jgi:GNAT superfamily N-acetyltransferase
MAASYIAELRDAHIPALFQLYQAQTERIPHCLPLSEARFQADLRGYTRGPILVAEGENGAALGFAALAPMKDEQGNVTDAVTVLFFQEETAGRELLDACAARARPGPLLAYPAEHEHCPIPAYNAGWNGLSDKLAPVARLLARSGFAPHYRELHLSYQLADDPQEPPTLNGIEIQAGISSEGDFMQRAFIGEERIGMCFYNLVSARTDDPGAQRIGYVGWLWTDERQRRRGIGRALMLHALAHLRTLGCVSCWLTTGAANWPAQPLYFALGFEAVDCSASYQRG